MRRLRGCNVRKRPDKAKGMNPEVGADHIDVLSSPPL